MILGGDQPRLLHAKSEHGYTHNTAEALPLEPEAVSAAEQGQLTAEAHRRWALDQARAWGTAAEHIGQALSTFVREGHPDRQLLSDVKAIERQVGRLDRRVNGRLSL